jgi:methyl-accepting chemotaxis protein
MTASPTRSVSAIGAILIAAGLLALLSAALGALGAGALPGAVAAVLSAAAAAVAGLLSAAREKGSARRIEELAEKAKRAEGAGRALQAELAAARGASLTAANSAPKDAFDPAEAGRSASKALTRLKFAEAIFSRVTTETEEAAFALLTRLMALRDQSARSAEAAKNADLSASGTGDEVETLAANARDTIERVRGALKAMREYDRNASSGLKALGQDLSSMIELLEGINEIAERSQLIAVNLAIEAARFGESGRGFKVIVGELRALNDRTATFSKRVEELLDGFRRHNEELVENAVTSSMQVAKEVEVGIGDEEKAINSLLKVSTTCVTLSDNVTDTVRAMNKELDGILESLQFQDITRQMIEGAMAAVSEARGDIGEFAKGADGSFRGAEERAWVDSFRAQMLARSKTRGEKDAIREVKA